MNVNKKNNWLKLKVDFFSTPQIKKLRKIAGGDKYLIIYQKLMLLTVNSEGHYEFQNLEPTLEEELALILDEDVDNLRILLSFLKSTNLMQGIDSNNIFFIEVPKLIGISDNSSERVAKYRALKKKERECNALHSRYNDVTCNDVTIAEKDIEKDIEKDSIPPTPYEGGEDIEICTLKFGEPDPEIMEHKKKTAFSIWQQIAKELEVEFTNSEWNQIKGYTMSHFNLPFDKIKARIMLLDKWANEGLDIETSLLQSHERKMGLKDPLLKRVEDSRGNRIYAAEKIAELRNRTIQKEKTGNKPV